MRLEALETVEDPFSNDGFDSARKDRPCRGTGVPRPGPATGERLESEPVPAVQGLSANGTCGRSSEWLWRPVAPTSSTHRTKREVGKESKCCGAVEWWGGASRSVSCPGRPPLKPFCRTRNPLSGAPHRREPRPGS